MRPGWTLVSLSTLPEGEERAIAEQGRGIAFLLAHFLRRFFALFFLFVDEQNPSEALRWVGLRTTFETPASWPRHPVGERRTEELAARRVCHWQNGSMVRRWMASAFLRTEKNFRKIMGYRDLWTLEAILCGSQSATRQAVA